jgi:hypothetical protein
VNKFWENDYAVYKGQVVLVTSKYHHKAQRWDGENWQEQWVYMVRDGGGNHTSWLAEDELSHPALCAECSKPVIDDYLCEACRD